MSIPQQNTKVNSKSKKLDPNKTAAVLGFATHLSQKLMPKLPQYDANTQQTMQGSQQPMQNGQQPQQNGQNPQGSPQIEKMVDTKLQELEQRVGATIENQISGIKQAIEQAINENG